MQLPKSKGTKDEKVATGFFENPSFDILPADNGLDLTLSKTVEPDGSNSEAAVLPKELVFKADPRKGKLDSAFSRIFGTKGDDDKELAVHDEKTVFKNRPTDPNLDHAPEDIFGSKEDDGKNAAVLNETPILVPWIVVDGSSIPLPTSSKGLPVTGRVRIGSTTFNYSLLSPSSIQIGSQILTPSSVIAINGHHVSFVRSPASTPPKSTVGRSNNNIRLKSNVVDSTAREKTRFLQTSSERSRILNLPMRTPTPTPTPTPTATSSQTATRNDEGGLTNTNTNADTNSKTKGAATSNSRNRSLTCLGSMAIVYILFFDLYSC